MIELPESKNLERQANNLLTNKEVRRVHAPTSPHKFCFFNGEAESYDGILKGQTFTKAHGHGMFLDLHFDNSTLSINDGVNIRYVQNPFERPEKYQLLIEFKDCSALVFTVAMYGGIFLHGDDFDNVYHQGSLNSVSPLSDEFNEDYFENLIKSCKKDLSMKGFLATQQRIPGLGNGCLQDILLTAGLHPKRKMSTLAENDKGELLNSIKCVLDDMTTKGGRDTERDMKGNYGNYKTMLSKKNKNCLLCGNEIIKESYLGGTIYFCPTCQKPITNEDKD